jgi:hypothetical protein
MRDVVILSVHLIVTAVRLARPGGLRSVVVSIPPVAGQPPSAGGDGNQDGALCPLIPSVCGAIRWNLAPRMHGPRVVLDDDRPRGEATRFPTLL